MSLPRRPRLLGWLRAARAALVVEAGLRTRPLDELAVGLGITLCTDQNANAGLPEPKVPAHTRWAFDAADSVLRFWPGGSQCLRRALIAGHLLREQKPSLHIGSARSDGRLRFHAWLQLEGRVTADPDARQYRRLVRLRPSS
jgi:Transglutaminase-like superfamily